MADELAEGAAKAAEIYGPAEPLRMSNNNRKGAFIQAASIRSIKGRQG